MKSAQIIPPSQDDFEDEHHSLYSKEGNRRGNMKAVLAFAGINPSKFSRRLNDEEPIRDHFYDVVMEMYGAKMSEQRGVGQGIVRMFDYYATLFGFKDEQPIDILELAVERLRSIDSNQIRTMSNEAITQAIVATTDLEGVAETVKRDLLEERNDRQARERKPTNARQFSVSRNGG